MCLRYEPHWYLDRSLFRYPHLHDALLEKITKICQRPEEAPIKRYYEQYCHPEFSPCWIIMEHLPFGACTSAFHNLKNMRDKKSICDVLGYHPIAVASWMDALRYTRNLCAHHARLWNRWFVMVPKLGYLYGGKFDKARTFYAQAIVIERLLRVVSPGSHWQLKLYNLLDTNNFVPVHKMGFAENWRDDPFWSK
jgi:abortive infection bacteriophage resistance protein